MRFRRRSLLYKIGEGPNFATRFRKEINVWKFVPKLIFMICIVWPFFFLLGLTFVSLTFGLHLLFAQIIYFDDQGKIDSRSIKGWPKIKGHKMYPIYFLLIILIFSWFPLEEIIFWICIALLPYLLLPLAGRESLSEMKEDK
ncbi:MAG: hypothetical protein KAQ63_01905 [Candidatus Moranbacteria bacterium]|nr:hypothetical protein [Candidatus Moranbacteria bacterium]